MTRRSQDIASTSQVEVHGIEEEKRIGHWLAKLPSPCGVMVCNDILGRIVLNACRRENLKVPDRIAVIGVDNDEVLCDLSSPPLSSVNPPCERIGYEAAALLDRLMRRKKLPVNCCLIRWASWIEPPLRCWPPLIKWWSIRWRLSGTIIWKPSMCGIFLSISNPWGQPCHEAPWSGDFIISSATPLAMKFSDSDWIKPGNCCWVPTFRSIGFRRWSGLNIMNIFARFSNGKPARLRAIIVGNLGDSNPLTVQPIQRPPQSKPLSPAAGWASQPIFD